MDFYKCRFSSCCEEACWECSCENNPKYCDIHIKMHSLDKICFIKYMDLMQLKANVKSKQNAIKKISNENLQLAEFMINEINSCYRENFKFLESIKSQIKHYLLWNQVGHAEELVTWVSSVMLLNRDRVEFSLSTQKLLSINDSSATKITEYVKLKDDVKNLKAENLEWQEKNAQLIDKVREIEKELIIQNQLYQEKQSEIQKRENEYKNVIVEIQNAKDKINKLESEILNYKATLSENQDIIRKYEDKAKKNSEEYKQASKKISEIENELAYYKKEYQENKELIRNYESEIQKYKKIEEENAKKVMMVEINKEDIPRNEYKKNEEKIILENFIKINKEDIPRNECKKIEEKAISEKVVEINKVDIPRNEYKKIEEKVILENVVEIKNCNKVSESANIGNDKSSTLTSDKWNCECGKVNESDWSICQKCKNIKPGLSGWVCKICTFLNSESHHSCRGCNQYSSSENKWQYYSCGDFYYSSIKKCYKCELSNNNSSTTSKNSSLIANQKIIPENSDLSQGIEKKNYIDFALSSQEKTKTLRKYENWRCERCYAMNNKMEKKCRKCRTEREDENWLCKMCFKMNNQIENKCRNCLSERQDKKIHILKKKFRRIGCVLSVTI
ncbi:hypothetical protein SteCoe_37590 [Stentor coeruleus]|uniref:RanBP2-type domain-containing protein n=1 Tax=Stentor coeruleus TaxID=5963 RepID=A0A1R2AMP5_9CILI|nr:hypothetical protein SteCoe_37590 [Stentor coeruleus]